MDGLVAWWQSLGAWQVPLRVLIIIGGAVVIRLILQFVINRTVRGVVTGVKKKQGIDDTQALVATPLAAVRVVQRTRTLGGVLSSVVTTVVVIVASLLVITTTFPDAAGAFSLILSCKYDHSIGTPILPTKEARSFSGLLAGQTEYIEHEMFLSPKLPAGNLTLNLEIKTALNKYPQWIGRYTLPVQEQQPVPEMEIFTVSQINQRLPQQTAILLVESATRHTEQRQLIRLRGWSATGQQLDNTALMQTIVSIEKL